MKRWLAAAGAHLVLALVWLLHFLPLPVHAALGGLLGWAMHALAGSRRRVALRNVELCLPGLDAAARAALVREHFRWLAGSLLERGVLWHASPARLRRLIQVEGDVRLAERSDRPVMWLVPHFLAIDAAGAAAQLFQSRRACNVYAEQSNPVLDRALRAGRDRFGQAEMFTRAQGIRPLARAIRRGLPFFNLPDMDFGTRDAAFVPFFGHPAATLLAPSRLARSLGMVVQPVVAEMLPRGRGWRIRFLAPWRDWPSDDAVDDAARMNRWIEDEIRRLPAQYLWVHRRFKTVPPGGVSPYAKAPSSAGPR